MIVVRVPIIRSPISNGKIRRSFFTKASEDGGREEETTCYNGRPEDFDSDECSDEEMHLFDQELDRIGGGFEIDFKKFRYCFGWRPLDLDDSTMVDEPETNRDFIATLVNMALTKHNEERVREQAWNWERSMILQMVIRQNPIELWFATSQEILK
ncbi:hypothetical protein Bca4012_047450 [Brassica carinata]